MKADFFTVTGGDGFWSRVAARKVRITHLEVPWTAGPEWGDTEHGELCAYFDPTTWDILADGLIYTDKLWIQTFRAELLRLGYSKDAADNVAYSEQGMQNPRYVSMDVVDVFIQEFNKLYTVSS